DARWRRWPRRAGQRAAERRLRRPRRRRPRAVRWVGCHPCDRTVQNRYRCRSARRSLVVSVQSTPQQEHPMKYMMLIAGEETSWTADTEEERRAMYERISGWWAEQESAGRIVDGHELEPSSTATT